MDTITCNTYALINAHHLLLRELYQHLLHSDHMALRKIAEDVAHKIKDDQRLPVEPVAAAEALEIRPQTQAIVEDFFRSIVIDTQFP
jgi:hypothetical protein